MDSSRFLRQTIGRAPMSSLKTGPQDHVFSLNPLGFPALHAPVRVLVVSPRIEVRRPLLRVVEACAGEVIVCSTLCEAEDALYFEAMGRGAFDVVRSPWHPTDLEMVVIRALREEQCAEPSVNA